MNEERLKYRNEIEYDWDNISFYAFMPDWSPSSDKVEPFDIFHSMKFRCYASLLFGKDILNNFEAYKEEIRIYLAGAYNGKREYEMLIGDLRHSNEDINYEHFQRINVYDMLLPNLDVIARILFENAKYADKDENE